MSHDLKIINGTKKESPDGSGHASNLPTLATVTAITEEGDLLLSAEGFGTFKARTTATVANYPADTLLNRQALITFEHDNPAKAIAVDILSPVALKPITRETGNELSANVDGETISLTAKEKIELRCGKGSISIDKRGHIRIRGTHLLSRSSGAVRIKGGNVSVN